MANQWKSLIPRHLFKYISIYIYTHMGKKIYIYIYVFVANLWKYLYLFQYIYIFIFIYMGRRVSHQHHPHQVSIDVAAHGWFKHFDSPNPPGGYSSCTWNTMTSEFNDAEL